jgi:hypothetical protein
MNRRQWLMAMLAGPRLLFAQGLLVDRGWHEDAAGTRIDPAKGMVADRFQIGIAGSVWIIQAVRLWLEITSKRNPGEVLEKIRLFGAIENRPFGPNEIPEPECDCHNLPPIAGKIAFSRTPMAGVWQVDLQELRWNVPGGINVQFGILGVARRGGVPWSILAVSGDGEHYIKLFDEKGRFQGPYEDGGGARPDASIGIAVRVWGERVK